jgi:prevent-host-death family protein
MHGSSQRIKAMRTIPAGEFKAKCLALMDEVEAHGETLVITKRGKPVARLVPIEPRPPKDPKSIFGFMRGTATIAGDIVNSQYSDEEWEHMFEEKFSDLLDEKDEKKP